MVIIREVHGVLMGELICLFRMVVLTRQKR